VLQSEPGFPNPGKPNPELYGIRKESLALLEQQSQAGYIDIFYGDESQVSEEGYVPYGWQFADEDICIQVAKGRSINCFALISRYNKMVYRTTQHNITADFVIEQLEQFSITITKPTVVVLDNARIHTARKVKERLRDWQARGLYLFYLPAYSPQYSRTTLERTKYT